jgi:hypothetical protein
VQQNLTRLDGAFPLEKRRRAATINRRLITSGNRASLLGGRRVLPSSPEIAGRATRQRGRWS